MAVESRNRSRHHTPTIGGSHQPTPGGFTVPWIYGDGFTLGFTPLFTVPWIYGAGLTFGFTPLFTLQQDLRTLGFTSLFTAQQD